MKTLLSVILAGLASSFSAEASAAVTLNGIFSDHMVLQRDAKVPVWGTADPGEIISVSFADQKAATKADGSGKWEVDLNSLKAGGPFTLTVSGATTLTLNDVLVGDVWLCSGQSNMAFSMSWIKNNPLYSGDLASANFPNLRQGYVPRKPSEIPTDTTDVKWTACTPDTVGDFTAAGFYFARDLQKELNVPIGLILSAWGGTSAESWTSIEALDTVPHFKERADQQLDNLKKLPDEIKNFPGLLNAWEKQNGRGDPGNAGEKNGWPDPKAKTTDWKPGKVNAKWRDNGLPNGGIVWMRKEITLPDSAVGKDFRLDLGAMDEQCTTAYFNGEKVGETGHQAPEFYGGYVGFNIPGRLLKAGINVFVVRFVSDVGDKSGTTKKPSDWGLTPLGATDLTDDCLLKVEKEFPPLSAPALAAKPACPKGDAAHTSSLLFGGMIHPLIPFAIKGCLWYQGEQDGGRGQVYRQLLPLMISDWRTRWGQGNFPFLIQQLPDWGAVNKDPEESGWAELREAQAMTAKALPNCGISVAIDVGEVNNVHPANKREVGRRLALVALAKFYGKPVAYTGPVYDSMTVEGSSVRLKFNHAEGLKSADGQPLKYFALAGDDHKFTWADARIDGDSVIVSSSQVTKPASVRYAWANSPVGCNLTNASGLPAMPFRTDDWPGVSFNRP